MKHLAACVIGLSLCTAASARLATYTEDQSSDSDIALGVAVPQPVNSSTALAGFRSYDALISQLELLALQSPDLTRHQVGSSLQQRPILAWRFGQNESTSLLQTGGSHAREWASPEAVAGIIEQLTLRADAGGIESWLRDTTSIVLLPVLNPDSFLATQQHASSTSINEDPQDSTAATAPSRSFIPRDGRMRRKNLRDSDGELSTSADNLFGVDINRNIGQFWASSTRSSNDPTSLVFHGSREQSEPETQALISAAELVPPGSLRLFIDTHSFGRVFFYNRTGNEVLFDNTRGLVDLIRTVPTISYAASQESAGRGIGASDEFFAYSAAFQVPSYTLEIEPGQNQIAEYGGNAGVSHSGFILPDSEVPRMRDEIYQMSLLAYYHQAGAPILKQLRVFESGASEPVVAAQWRETSTGRELVYDDNQALNPAQRYRMQLIFDKPMRLRRPDGATVGYSGQAQPLPPSVKLGDTVIDSSQGQWRDTRYVADTFELSLSPPPACGSQALSVSVRDLANMALDSDPGTVIHWADGQWQNWENEFKQNSQSGGIDQSFRLQLDSTVHCNTSSPASGGGSGGISWLMLALLALLRGRR